MCPNDPDRQRYHILCEAGTYQPDKGQTACLKCPAGSYCDGQIRTATKTCPRGRYCPTDITIAGYFDFSGQLLGTRFADEYPCLAGTYSTSTGLTAASECTACDKGYYCQFKGASSVSTVIIEGYHGNDEDGHTAPDAYICPEAAYCEEKSETYTPCPDGTWTLWQKATKASDCIPCARGYFCKFTTMQADSDFLAWKAANPSEAPVYTLQDLQDGQAAHNQFLDKYYGPCASGYICYEGATSETPQGINVDTDGDGTADGGEPCPVGYFCPAVSDAYYGLGHAMPCLPGTYNGVTQESACAPCLAGEYCADFGMTAGEACPQGYHCPLGSISPTPCPPGKYGSPPSSQSEAACLPCDAQYFCPTPGQFELASKCASGFVCGTGNDRAGPYATTSDGTSSGKCPVGVACGSGATQSDAAYVLCPAGSYNDKAGAEACLECPPGSYCTGLSAKVNCDGGFYCSLNSNIPAPVGSELGDECQPYYYCPSGAGQPLPCLDGTWGDEARMEACKACEEGFICSAGIKEICPNYRYCDGLGSEYTFGQLCPNGTYGIELDDDDDYGFNGTVNCTACPAAQFCTAGRITGDCAPGYVCLQNANQHTPNIEDAEGNNEDAYPCPLGYYCEEGTEFPELCPLGTFTFEEGGM